MEPIQITLTLHNRPFKIKVLPQSEEALRNAVKDLNANIDTYKKSYPGRDDFEYLAMSVMTLISAFSENTSNAVASEETIVALKKVEAMLS
jgi:Cell division protein ZapA